MKINLISRDNGIGLTTDMELLEAEWGEAHDVARVPWEAATMRGCDVAVFLELFNPRLLNYARCSVGVFNLEWFPQRWRGGLRALTQLWAKGRQAQELLLRWGLRSSLTGWLGRDMYDATVPRQMRVLHHRGASSLKGTEQVLEAWARHGDRLPPLTVISATPIPHPPAGVSVHGRLPFDDVRQIMNSHAIHLCPSRAEGWGHYLAEAVSTGAITITTDASPMNEHVQPDWGFLLPARFGPLHHCVHQMIVDADHIAATVTRAAGLPPAQQQRMASRARDHWHARNGYFRAASAELLQRMAP